MMQVVREKWGGFVLWVRWHRKHLCPLPDKDPAKNTALYRDVTRPRLGKIVMEIREHEDLRSEIAKDRERVQMILRKEESKFEKNILHINHLKRQIQRLDKKFEKERCKTEVALATYDYYWALYEQANGLDPAWGNKWNFRSTFKIHTRYKNILMDW